MLVRIGTRGSPLALAQARDVESRLKAAHSGLTTEIVIIKTTGDKVQDRALSEIGGKGLFTKELEESLFDGSIDMAVHSMKDVPTKLPTGLGIGCILEREDPRDALISAFNSVDELPEGAIIGTSSLRRAAQLLHLRPDLKIVPLRGNVETRLRKVREGEVNATILAMAGLRRLGMFDAANCPIDTTIMLPAVAQGAVGIESREGDERINALLHPLNHTETAACVMAERGFLTALDGNCTTPIAAHAVKTGDSLILTGLLAEKDGSSIKSTMAEGDCNNAFQLGLKAGKELLKENASQ